MGSPKTDEDIVRSTGRGVIFITLAKMWFMLTGYVVAFGLPRIFKWAADGDADQGQALYGTYKIVFMGVSFINNGIITGTIQAVSKFTSEDVSNAGAVRRLALRIQGGLGIAIAVLYAGFAGFLSDVLGSKDLAFLMRISSGIIVAYSCYAVFIGSFNGRRLYSRQALFDFSYQTMKTMLILVLAAVGFEVLGTVLGFLIAAVVIAIAAALVSGVSGQGGFSARRYLSFAALLFVYTFLLNLVMSLDLFLLKGIAASAAIQAGHDAEAASSISKTLVGQYSAAQALALIPYQAILSIAFVAFPMISKVTFSKDTEKTRIYVQKTLRFSMILIAGLAAVFGALPEQSLGLLFESEYVVAADALSILYVGIAAFGMMATCNTILNGAGLPWRAMAVVLVTLIAVVTSVTLSLKFSGLGPSALKATAIGSTIGMGFGLVVSGIVVYHRFGTFWPWMTGFRVLLAVTAAVSLGRYVLPDAGKVVTLAECIAVVVVYFLVLVTLREFSREDMDQLRQIFSRGKGRQ
ncbi:MAG: oligosaccharide flippase family protein [Myxococcota bacterium]|nr:oligosaccharide flippase family protein [Myxococcota bacterium]